MANTSKKIFVLDTNVILHDATCIQNFEDNEVVIPISALEELDQFKRGNEQIHYNACLLYTSPSPRDVEESRMPSSA